MICRHAPCSRNFDPRKPWQVYCSARCRNTDHNATRKNSGQPPLGPEVTPQAPFNTKGA